MPLKFFKTEEIFSTTLRILYKKTRPSVSRTSVKDQKIQIH